MLDLALVLFIAVAVVLTVAFVRSSIRAGRAATVEFDRAVGRAEEARRDAEAARRRRAEVEARLRSYDEMSARLIV